MNSGGTVRLERTDRRVLCHLDETGADYPALIASNTGLHIPLVERRIVELREQGYVEKVSEEAIYRITESGTEFVGTLATPASD